MGRGLDDRRHRRASSAACSAPAGAASPWAALATTLAMCSRSSVGARRRWPPSAILAGGNLLAASVRRRGDRPGRWLGRLRWAASAPAPRRHAPGRRPGAGRRRRPSAVYAAVNYIKFATLFSIPFYSQGFTIEDDRRGGSSST